MYKGNKIGVLIPTRDEKRKRFLDHAKWQITRQTLQPDIILIVDYKPDSEEKDLSQRYHLGFENLINVEKCDCIICWEDDDFYKPNYIETMVFLWDKFNKPAMFGFDNSYYYNINDQKYFNVKHPNRASMMNTLVSRDILEGGWNIEDNDPWTDFRLWTTKKNVRAIPYNEIMCVGIKHGIGLCGGNNHESIYQNMSDKEIKDDEGMKWLESVTDYKSINLYRSLSKTYKTIDTEIKEVDVVVPCYTMNEDLKFMTKQFILNLNNSEKDIKFNIYIMEQNPNVVYDGAVTLHYDFEFNYNKVLNLGLQFCKNKYVCFCNNDVTFSYGWASEIIKQMKKYECLSASPFNPVILKPKDVEVEEGYELRKQMLGWCIMTDRDIFDVIGKFDESVNFWKSEVVYSDQLKENNLKHILVYNSVVFHYDMSRTLNKIDKNKYQEFTTIQNKIYAKRK